MNDHHFQDINKLASEKDYDGLEKLLEHGDQTIRMQAALALAELGNSLGWRYLSEAALQSSDPEAQASAAVILGDLDPARALPILEEALLHARGETAEAIKKVIEAIGGIEADEALREAGYEPVLPHLAGNLQLVDYGGEYVRSIRPGSEQIAFLTAEQHHDLAVELREAEMTERGLVENSLALWLSPEWAYAWYLRGVLFEDLERRFEAVLSYRWALEIDPEQADARDALAEIEAADDGPDEWMQGLGSMTWNERRDAAAGFGDMGEAAPEAAVERLIELLNDGEREVRHAAIEALGNIGDTRAVEPLQAADEASWLLRFGIIEALAQLGNVDGLAAVLHREMDRIQERNPVFSSAKDPMLEVEYERLMEIGVLAFEKAGDVEALIGLAEDNAWVEVEEDEDLEEDLDVDDFDDESDEELGLFVDEVALMASLALERAALPDLANLSAENLQRLAAVPDLTLLDASGEDEQPVIIHDLSALREAARAALASR